jgi:hypothetical protein
VHKAALIHDVIRDVEFDFVALTETWITSDAPDAIKLDVAPSGYHVHHQARGSSSEKRGGGVAIVHRETMKVTCLETGGSTEFESWQLPW